MIKRINLLDNRITLINGDCLEILPKVKPACVDMVFADLPYGTTARDWDKIIPNDRLWPLLRHTTQDDSALVFTGSQPFSSLLITSNLAEFKYEWVWYKPGTGTGYVNAKNMPMKYHENIMVFSRGDVANGAKLKMRYFPQGLVPINVKRKITSKAKTYLGARPNQDGLEITATATNYPISILEFARDHGADRVHPTQKPVELLEYLIKTYTSENDVVLDPTAGSFTTAVACINTNRRCIAIEKDADYFQIGVKRCEEAINARQ